MVVSMSKMKLWFAVLQVVVALEENCLLQSHPVAGLDLEVLALGLQKACRFPFCWRARNAPQLYQTCQVEKDGEHLSEDRDMLAPKAKEAGAEPAEARTLGTLGDS